MENEGLNRRAAMSVGLSAFLGGCAVCGDLPRLPPADARLRIGDGHTHFFNAADLPVAGFFRDVLVPQYLKDWPEFALAFIDIALAVLKSLAIPADRELGQLRAPWAESDDPSPETFADAVDRRARTVLARESARTEAAVAPDPLTDLAASYRALAAIVNAAGSASLAPAAEAARDGLFDRAALAAVATGSATPGESLTEARGGRSPAEILQLIAWAFRMTQSRCSHVRQYLALMENAGTVVDVALNLLVDYDAWLNDTPTPGSGQAMQVEFWTRYARAASERLRIVTFAGYDPLRHAVENRTGKTRYFSTLETWARAAPDAPRRVAGFKLYPPMGFRMWQNPPLPSPNPQRSAGHAARLWTGAELPIEALPGELDRAIGDFLSFAMANDIPLLAHARDSNEAFKGAGEYAHPHWWLERVRATMPLPAGHRPLRLCLAHYDDMFDIGDDVREILAMNLLRQTNIYFDIAYEVGILKQPDGAKWLLDRLERVCGGNDAAAEYFIFGTDWIMLGQEVGAANYLPRLDAALKPHGFWGKHREKLLGGNLRRFLKLEDPAGRRSQDRL